MPIIFDAVATELHIEFYKGKLEEINIGPEGRQINGEEFIKTCKYLYILSSIFEQKQRLKFDENKKSDYYTLVPVIKERNLIHRLMGATGWSRDKCKNSLSLFYFDTQNKKIDIWFQPLIPIGGGNLLLVPCIAKSIDVVRLFESHFSQWKVTFDFRGPLFEDSIRKKFKEIKISVVPFPIKFSASDGKEVEFDVVAWFKDYLILIEAKCLKIPHSAIDMYYCWNDILGGVGQLIRRRKLLKSDWEKIKKLASIDLPETPPKENNILCILITNIFNFTGFEVDGIRITDFACFRRYFAEPDIKRKTLNHRGEKTEKVVARIWEGEEPVPEEMWSYIKNPPNLKELLQRIKVKYGPIPPLDEEDKEIFCIPYTIID